MNGTLLHRYGSFLRPREPQKSRKGNALALPTILHGRHSSPKRAHGM